MPDQLFPGPEPFPALRTSEFLRLGVFVREEVALKVVEPGIRARASRVGAGERALRSIRQDMSYR